MDEVVEALEKYHGLVPLVYDIETMSLDEARHEDMQTAVYLKREADKVIAEKDAEIAKLRAMLEERNKQVGELKDSIAPKRPNKTLQERLNEVCKKHGVSTLQDLDWAFCESEKRHTKDNIEADKAIADLEESHKMEVEQLLMEIVELKEKYKELAKLHDKAIQACCDADKVIAHHKYKRCLAMAYVEWLRQMILCDHPESILYRMAARREYKWKEMAQKFKEAK